MINPIYKPSGKALEYAPLALNIYEGCSHLCTYCFAKKMHDRWKPNEDFADVKPREGIVEATKKQLSSGKFKGKNILLCFSTDPYCDIDTTPTKEIIEAIKNAGANFTVLTKGGMRASRDFSLYEKGDSFGTTLTVRKCSERWEKGAAPVDDRIAAIITARTLGIKTWVSLEPIIIPADALDFIHILHKHVDLWKVGRWNYDSRANQIDWKQTGENVEMVLKMHGCNYYIKDDLRKAMEGNI
ncbi:conserved hypothetical protein [Candidatus Desulfosporosinus infrequens]|uniref:Radical SAM core domain-containing protein n=1 Tax=Candidatus Desulfosporosinus infrequens TaxID=2043169 RepID=A0A2U3LH28_9FIRM|nr:conserved hypothetical protein [Candidatus Desulfosporosinus infrequens]